MSRLTGKALLVAGGATGIGAAVSSRLASEGARVCIGDVNLDAAQETVDRIVRAGGTAYAVHYDQAEESSIVELVAAAVSHLGGLDGVHCNAADLRGETLRRDVQVMKMDPALWEHLFRVNLTGYGLIIREVLPHLLAAHGGSIVCTSSDAPEAGMNSQVAYGISKAGVNALVRHVSTRFGKQNIRANAIAPGLVLSAKVAGDSTEQSLAKFLESTRSPRLGQPDDIAGAVAFLLSDDGEWVNGQVWSVDGGLVFRG